MSGSSHKLDTELRPTGQHYLWEEVKRLRKLVREGERLVDQLECAVVESDRSLYLAAVQWRTKANAELGTS